MRRKILIFITVVMVFIAFAVAVFAAAAIPIIIDGKEVDSDVPPVLVKNRTMVPIRVISKNLGAQIVWQNPNIIIQRDNIELKLTLKSKTAYKNGNTMATLEAAPFLQNDRTMVPLRFIAEALDIDITYEDGKVLIGYNPKTAFLTEGEIIYQDSFTIIGIKDGVLYITSVLATNDGLPAEKFADSINVHEQRIVGEIVYFAYRPPGTEGGLSLIYAFKDGKSIRAFKASNLLFWEVRGNYIYGASNPYPDINDFSTNKPPYGGNLYRVVDITKEYDKQEIEDLGVEGYLYGYDITFRETGEFQDIDVENGNLTPKFDIKEDGIYAMGVELYSVNAKATYGYYKINLEGRSHEKVNDIF